MNNRKSKIFNRQLSKKGRRRDEDEKEKIFFNGIGFDDKPDGFYGDSGCFC
jgi:hypothetical protein